MLNKEYKLFPISVVCLDDGLFVTNNFSTNSSIKAGHKIVSINGISADSIYRFIRRYVPRDGYNLTSPDHVLGGKFGGFRNFYSIFFGRPDIFEITIQDIENRKKKVLVEAELYSTMIARNKGMISKEKEMLSVNINGNTAVMGIRSFHPGKIKNGGQNYVRFFKKSFQKFRKNGVENLVIDLRKNGGGHQSVFIDLASYLVNRPFTVYKQLSTITDSVPNHSYYLEKELLPKLENQIRNSSQEINSIFCIRGEEGTTENLPQKPTFRGAVFVLIDGSSSSATGDFTGFLKSQEIGKFIGEEAGGNPVVNCAGKVLTLVLPNTGIQTYIPTTKYELNVDFPNSGHGVQPDLLVKPTIQDILSGQDPVLDRALNLIRTKNTH